MYHSVKTVVSVPSRYRRAHVSNVRSRFSKIWLTVIAIFFITVIFSTGIFMLQGSHTEAANNKTTQIYYKSIQIEQGDSLWSIAEDYMNPEFDSIHAYIREVKRLNHISSDQIHAGAYLVIPYYVSDVYE